MAEAKILANGQLAAASAAVVTGTRGNEGTVTLVLQNTGTSEETIILTLTPAAAGSTARRLARVVLNENEQFIVRNIPIAQGDVLSGYTTTASTVDYLAFGGGGLVLEAYDANGTGKGVTTLRKILTGVEQIVGDELSDPG